MRIVGAIIAIAIILGGVFVVLHMFAGALGQVTPKRNESVQTCLGHQRQLAQAVQMYLQDHNRAFFPEPDSCAWTVLLAPYLSPGVYDCPAFTDGTGTAAAPEYGVNAALYGVVETRVLDPAATLLTADLAKKAMRGTYALASDADLGQPHVLKRAVNVCALDGHAETVIQQAKETLPDALTRVGITLTVKQAPTLLP